MNKQQILNTLYPWRTKGKRTVSIEYQSQDTPSIFKCLKLGEYIFILITLLTWLCMLHPWTWDTSKDTYNNPYRLHSIKQDMIVY